MTTDIYQHAKTDGDADWTDGQPNFAKEWEIVRDLARFHRGKGFRIRKRPDRDYGQKLSLDNVDEALSFRIAHNPPKTVFELRAVADDWSLLIRRLESPSTGDKVVEFAEARIGVPYRLGYRGPEFYDCSGLTLASHASRAGVDLPHNAAAQHSLFRGGVPGFVAIQRPQVKRGDLVFTNHDDHVVLYYGTYKDVECCIDTEPSDTSAPWGGMLGTGIRIRPMTGNYYNSWERVNGIGRIIAVNGSP